MGIKGLFNFLKENGVVPETVPLAAFAGQRVAVDGQLLVTLFKKANPAEWLRLFEQHVAAFTAAGARLLFAFDGPHKSAKEPVHAARANQRHDAQARSQRLHRTLLLEGIPVDPGAKEELNRFRRRHQLPVPAEEPFVTAEFLRDFAAMREQAARNATSVERVDFAAAIRVLLRLGVDVFLAEGEGERLCAHWTESGAADVVYSHDSDCLALGVPILITKVSEHRAQVFRLSTVLGALGLGRATFLDFCVLVGTDFNRNVDRKGPRRVFDALRKPGATAETVLAEWKSAGLDTSVVRLEETRRLFAFDPREVFHSIRVAEVYLALLSWLQQGNSGREEEGSPKPFYMRLFLETLC